MYKHIIGVRSIGWLVTALLSADALTRDTADRKTLHAGLKNAMGHIS